MSSHEQHAHRILCAIAAGRPVTQRALARESGIALGLANLVIRRLVDNGAVAVEKDRSRHPRYVITPAGLTEMARLEAARLADAVHSFAETRDQLREGLRGLSRQWSPKDEAATKISEKRIVFYGAGELAEIAYLALHETDLRLIGVVDDRGGRTFFGLPVHPLERLSPNDLDGQPFWRFVIVSPGGDGARARLAARGVSEARVFMLEELS